MEEGGGGGVLTNPWQGVNAFSAIGGESWC